MTQINFNFCLEEFLQSLSQDRDGAFRKLLQSFLNILLQLESEAQLQAAPYERSAERTDSRNGTRERSLKTRIGTITLTVPRHRNQPFHTMLFENYSRSEAALISVMAEMVVNGVSTRKVSKVMEELCGTSISKSAVSEACRKLDKEVEAFRNRPIEKAYPFLTVDATYFKVREEYRVVSKALFIAYGADESEKREVLGFSAYRSETEETWMDFFRMLKRRGLKSPLLLISDAHQGIISAAAKEFPEVPWQRCQFHFTRNILTKIPKKYQAGIRTELREMFTCETMEEARKKRDQIIADYRDVAEEAMKILDEGFESAMTVMILPKGIRNYFRTSNHLERLNKELKRRSHVIGVFPNEKSLIRLMGAVLMEQNDLCQTRSAMYSQRYFEREILKQGVREKLIQIAEEQAAWLAA